MTPRIEEASAGSRNNARLIAELQSVTIGIHLVGLNRLPEVMNPDCAHQINDSKEQGHG